MNLHEHVKEIEGKYLAGQEIFRRKSVGFLLERISQLEQAAQPDAQRTDCTDCGAAVSDDDATCPNCGLRNPANASR